MKSYLDNMNSISDNCVAFKRVNKYKLRFKTKSSIIPALQKSISVKTHFLKNPLIVRPPTPYSQKRNIYKLSIGITEIGK